MRGIFCRRSCLQGTQGECQGEEAALNELGIVCSRLRELDRAVRYFNDNLEQVAKEILAND